ncbi:uncharacterized protein N0V89_010599 [Didymosphaeria variabile]|uniref:Uncharacterized protein n=1 Tax=Didymosphaeria variabile TaxID=1932322 RepID=A0A9W8XBW7_9PLEO|nr:uncharacterized protein N0V89_010599 [Didymosphaeria variabile]KAJ4346668.1 hypothetical protein N0V89_010599 [Didymosphaeria variabile]
MATSSASPQGSLIAVATVPFTKHFPTVTLYEETATTSQPAPDRRLWFNQEGKNAESLKGASPSNWKTIAPTSALMINQPVQTVAGVTPTTNAANFWWDASGGKLGYWEQEIHDGATTTVQSSTEVTVQAQTTNQSTAQETNTSAAPTQNDKPPGAESNTTIAPTSDTTATSSSSTTTAAAAAANISGSKDIQPGAAAGIGVGCFLAGLLIAGLLAWFFMKRRRSTSSVRDSEASAVALMHREKGPVAKTVSVSSGSPIASALENGLPQPLEDKAVSGEISKISNLIKNHVQSYYHSRAVSPGMIDYDDLQALGENLPVSVGTLSTLLNNPTTREIALRFCLAWVVTSRIRLNDSSNKTFLPPEVAKCMQSMNHTERGSRGKLRYLDSL